MSTPTDEQDKLLQKLRDLIERSGEKEDTFGSEMADDARVWRVYFQAARKYDSEKLSQWNAAVDTLPTFAGLFSAISATFIIDSYKQMQPDYSKETFQVLLANVSGTHYIEPSDKVGASARAVNCLWIASLIASLSTGLFALLAKQWIASYPVSSRENLREWAQLRQYRLDAFQRWCVPALIAVVPVLLHLSLLLFLAGLVLFLSDIDTGTMIITLILSAATYGFYGFTMLAPLLWNQSPFRTSLHPLLERIAHLSVNTTADAIYRLYRIAERNTHRSASFIGDVQAAVGCPACVTLSSLARSMIYRLRDVAVLAVTRSVVAVYSFVIDPIYRLYRTAARIAGRGVAFVIGKLVAAVMSPTSVTLHSLAICTTLCFLAVHAATRFIIELCSLFVSMLCRLCRISYTAIQSVSYNVSLRVARVSFSRKRSSAIPIDPWVTQVVFSPGASARALSWLGLNSDTTDIYHAVLDGLGDKDRGALVTDDLAPAMKTRISVCSSDIISPYYASDNASDELQVVVRHLRVVANLPNLLPSRKVMDWIFVQVEAVRRGDTELRTQRDFDTLLRVSTLLPENYNSLVRFFGSQAGQKACESPSLILSSTVYAIVQLFIDAKEPGRCIDFRSDDLAMLNALRTHFVASPHLAVKLFKSSFADEEGAVIANAHHHCGRVDCEATTYLVAILAQHDFGYIWHSEISTEVRETLKDRTFATFALFCREFQRSERCACTELTSNLNLWLSKDNLFSQISLCGRDVASFVPLCESLSPGTRIRMLQYLLDLDQSWCAPESSDLGRDDALDACLLHLATLSSEDIGIPEARLLLDNACLERLQRAPRWNLSSLLSKCAETLASAGDDDPDAGRLVSKFIYCEGKGGADGASTGAWDLVVAGSRDILVLAEKFAIRGLRSLCSPLLVLRGQYPYNHRWKEMGERVRQGAEFLYDPAWTARNSEDGTRIQHILEEFWTVMIDEEGRFSRLEMNTALLWAADEP